MYSAIELKELTITQNDESKSIAVRFNTKNFCHLLCVETIAKRAVKYSELHNYRGDDGWNNIKSGTIDIKHLKALNKKKFLIVNYCFIAHMIMQ